MKLRYKIFIIWLGYTVIMLTMGLWSELELIIKHGNLDQIIGPRIRWLNNNFFSNLYIAGIIFLLIPIFFILSYFDHKKKKLSIQLV